MREIVRRYCNILEESMDDDGEMIPFDDKRLAPFHERMTHSDFLQVGEWLKDIGEAMLKEGNALEAYGRAKFGPKLRVIQTKEK